MREVVFVSHAHEDRGIALEVAAHLEVKGIQVFVASKSIREGENFSERIAESIEGCRIFILILSSHSNESKHVLREVNLADRANCVIIPFRIESIEPAKGLRYYLQLPQWLDSFEAGHQRGYDTLTRRTEEILKSDPEPSAKERPLISQSVALPSSLGRPRLGMGMVVTVSAGIMAAVIAFGLFRQTTAGTSQTNVSRTTTASVPRKIRAAPIKPPPIQAVPVEAYTSSADTKAPAMVRAVEDYYSYWGAQQLSQAWDLLSPTYQKGVGHAAWYASHSVSEEIGLAPSHNVSGDTVEVTVLSGSGSTAHEYDVTWDLVLQNGRWLLDRSKTVILK